MSKRTAKFVATLFASLFAGTPLATVSHGATEAADNCLSAPKATAPEGRHWYYRVDRASKRNCWYLRAEGEKISRAASENPALPAAAAAPLAANPKNPDTGKSIANARAELPSPQTRAEPANRSVAPQPMAPSASEINQPSNAGDTGDQGSAVATRWLDPANMSTSTLSRAPSVAPAPRLPQLAEAAPRPAASTVTLAAAEAAAPKPTGSVQMLLIVVVGALSVAGLIGSAIVRFGKPDWRGRDAVDRRVSWDSVRSDRPSLADEVRAADPLRRVDIPRIPRSADDPNQRIAQMLERLARSAAT